MLTHRVQDVAVTAAVQEGGHCVLVASQGGQVEHSLTGLEEELGLVSFTIKLRLKLRLKLRGQIYKESI